MTLLSRPLSKNFVIYGLYVLLALIVTFPILLHFSTQVLGGTTGDNYEMLRNIWWFKFALQNGEPLYYQTYMGYPQGFSSIALAANQLQYLPAYLLAFVMPLAMAYNLTIILTIALNGWSVYWLMRYLLGEQGLAPAFLAGVVFAIAPTFQGHLFEGHAGLMVMWPVPLFVWALFNLVRAESKIWRWGLMAMICFNLSPSGHMLQVIYMLMPLTALFLLGLVWQRDWRGVRRVFVVCALSGAFMLVFLAPIIADTLKTSAYTDAGGVVRYSSDLLALVSPSFLHPMWNKILSYPAQVLGVNLGEGVAYVGVLVALLIGLAVWKVREARWWALFFGVCWILSLGSLLKIFDQPIQINLGDYQTYVPLPWALVQDVVGFSLARTPARFNFALALAVAVMAGYGAQVLWTSLKNRAWHAVMRYGVLTILLAGIVWDYQFFFPMPTRPAEIPQAVYDLRERTDIRAIFSVPWEHLLAAKDDLYLQTAHEKPLIAGQITRQTPVNPAKLNVMQASLAPELLKAQGADVLIFHKDRARELGQYDTLSALLQTWDSLIYEDDTLAIFNVPSSNQPSTPYLQAQPAGEFTSAYVSDIYSPNVGWIDFNAIVSADDRGVTLYVNNQPLHQWQVTDTLSISVPIPIEQEGFYRVALRLDEPCPSHHPTTLACRDLTVRDPYFAVTESEFLRPQIPYENGVTLIAVSASTVEDVLEVRLWWKFDEALQWDRHVRFVHVLDATGNRIAQNDEALGDIPAQTEWVETVRFPLADIPRGEYSVRVGWYTYPDLVRFAVLDKAVIGASDRAPQVARVSVP